MEDNREGRWLTAWAQAHTDMNFMSGGVRDNTVRITVRNRIPGTAVRVCLSNRCGKRPAEIVHVSAGPAGQRPAELRFGGKNALRLDPGETAYSDPVEMEVRDGEELAVSVAVKGRCRSGNNMDENVRYSSKGDFAMEASMPEAKDMDKTVAKAGAYRHGPFMPLLSRIEIFSAGEKNIVACFGDSITQQCRWTKPLDGRCAGSDPDTVIVNMAIDGNKLLTDPSMKLMALFGEAGIGRFRSDVLDAPGVTAVVFALGTNDIGLARSRKDLAANGHEAILAGLLGLNAQAKAAGLKTYAATLTPRGGSKGYKPMHEEERLLLNEAIRNSDAFDGILDYDAAVKDEKDPGRMRGEYQCGDWLHPGTEGGLRMAEEAYRVIVRQENGEQVPESPG